MAGRAGWGAGGGEEGGAQFGVRISDAVRLWHCISVYFPLVCTLDAQTFLDSDLLKLWGTVAPEGGQLPDLRFTSGSKDETRSQCLGDNEVFL